MKELTQLQKEYTFFKDMLNSLERKKKKTPGNGFAIMKCKEKIAELESKREAVRTAANGLKTGTQGGDVVHEASMQWSARAPVKSST